MITALLLVLFNYNSIELSWGEDKNYEEKITCITESIMYIFTRLFSLVICILIDIGIVRLLFK